MTMVPCPGDVQSNLRSVSQSPSNSDIPEMILASMSALLLPKFQEDTMTIARLLCNCLVISQTIANNGHHKHRQSAHSIARCVPGSMRPSTASRLVLMQQTIASKERETANSIIRSVICAMTAGLPCAGQNRPGTSG